MCNSLSLGAFVFAYRYVGKALVLEPYDVSGWPGLIAQP